MKKKLLVLALAALMIFAFASCGNDESTSDNSESQGIAKEDIKVGFVYIGAIGDEGWTDSHNDGRLYLEEELGVETAYMENVTEDSGCEDAIRNLIDQGCNVIFTTSFGFGEWTQKVALDHPDLYFMHASGNIQEENMSNYFGRIYQARYLSGIAAGMKTETNKIGYVAAMGIPEVVRGITPLL